MSDIGGQQAMDESLLRRVADVTADLTPAPGTTVAALRQARVAVAAAAARGQQIFSSRPSALVAAEADPRTLTAIDDALGGFPLQQLPSQRVIRRDTPTVAAPIPSLGPTATTGRAIAASYGPFLDALGRPVLIDVFDVLPFVGIKRTGAAAPFLYVLLPANVGTADTLTLGAGTVWIAAEALASGTPASGFVGLRIASGRVSFGRVTALNTSPIIVPANATVRLSLVLASQPPAAGSGPGADAREAHVVVPANAGFTFAPAGGRVTSAAAGSIAVFGAAVQLHAPATPAAYDAVLGRVNVPFATDVHTFAVTDSRSTLVTVRGTAPLRSASWSLPVTIETPSALGTAAGAGGIALALDPGLSMRWHDEDAACNAVEIVAEPSTVMLAGLAARASGSTESVALWDAGPRMRGRLELRHAKPFPFGFVSESAGHEAFAFFSPLVANLDAPRTVNDERVRFCAPSALVAFFQSAAGTLFLAEALAPPEARAAKQSYAIKNLVLAASDPLALVVAGAAQGDTVSPGALALQFALRFLLPTLPDPYAANIAFDPRRLLDSGSRGVLTGFLRWKPKASPAIDLALRSEGLAEVAALSPHPTLGQPGPPALLALATGDRSAEDGQAIAAMRAGADVVPGRSALALLDLSTNVSLFGVAYTPSRPAGIAATPAAGSVAIANLLLEATGSDVLLMALPAVQWEPVLTPDQTTPFPSPLTFADCGGPTSFLTETVALVPVAPRPVIDAMLVAYHDRAQPHRVRVRFTLPFGIDALASLQRSTDPLIPGPALGNVAPTFAAEGLAGGDQITIRAARPRVIPLGPTESASLPGSAYQLHNARFSGVPTPTTVLTPIDDTFNTNFGPAAPTPRIPVTRIDISGFGESLFNDWRNPSDAAAIISKAQFEVLVGRTSREVVQAYSVLYPYAARVVRTITIERQNGAAIVRHDSGWQAVTDGVYRFPKPDLVTHPGVVRAAVGIANIRDTGQRFTTSDGSELMAVRFDCSIQLENIVLGAGTAGVPARDQIGYVQLTDPHGYGQLAPDQYAQLLAAAGPLGGPVDAVIDIGGSGQRIRVAHVGVAATPGMGSAEFAMAAWGSPLFPGGGQWSVLRQVSPGDAPVAVDADRGVPLVRAGAAGGPPPNAPYRFADPEDTLQPDAPAADYGIVHATGTQRVFFPRPKIEADGPHAITSTRVPLIADPYVLATANGPFPKPDGCIPFPDANYALAIDAGGNFTLQRATGSFTTAPLKRILRESQALRSIAYCADENGNPSVVTLAIDTAAATPYSLTITNMSIASESGSLGEMTRVVGTLSASPAAPTTFTDSRFVFGPPLKPAAAVVSFLEKFSPLPPPGVAMTNSLSLQVSRKFDKQILLDGFPGTPIARLIERFVEDLDCTLGYKFSSEGSVQFVFQFELVIKFITPFTTVTADGDLEGVVGIGLGKVQIQMGDDVGGVSATLQVGGGVGVTFPLVKDKIEATGYYASTLFFIKGSVAWGVGASALVKGTIDFKIVEVDLSIESKTALLHVDCNVSDSTIWLVGQVTIALEITIAFVIDIEFDYQTEWDARMDGGPCALPNVV